MPRNKLIRARASDNEKQSVEKIRKHHGLGSEAEVVRYLVRKEEEEIDRRKDHDKRT